MQFPQLISDHSLEHNSIQQQQVTSTDNIFDKIPQLEEDWENSQFADADADANLTNRHNTHSESEGIQKKYSEHLLDLTDNQCYSEDIP